MRQAKRFATKATGRSEVDIMVWEYTVTGTGYFPTDMLRYDSAWPSEEGGLTLADRSTSFFTVKRSTNLTGLKPPTVARWKSFGWEVS